MESGRSGNVYILFGLYYVLDHTRLSLFVDHNWRFFLSNIKVALLTITLPTLYLCMVDTIALRAGTWHISEKTSTQIFVIKDLPLEEAVFFLVTNTLLVLGMSAFEKFHAVIDVFGDLLKDRNGISCPTTRRFLLGSFSSPLSKQERARIQKDPQSSSADSGLVPHLRMLVSSILLPISSLPSSHLTRLTSFSSVSDILKIHSHSFHTASYIFPSDVRKDLVILYAFCRVLDDFVDESETTEEAESLVQVGKDWLDLLYGKSTSAEHAKLAAAIGDLGLAGAGQVDKSDNGHLNASGLENGHCGEEKNRITCYGEEKAHGPGNANGFHSVTPNTSPLHGLPQCRQISQFEISSFLYKRVPPSARSSFFLLSTIAHKIPRYPFDDLIKGYEWDLKASSRPIQTEDDLVQYSRLVASSVAEMCVWAIWSNNRSSFELLSDGERKDVLEKAANMGVALQITNISRDIREDALNGRIYIPKDWFDRYAGDDSSIEADSSLQDYRVLQSTASTRIPPNGQEFRYPVYIRQLLNLADVYQRGTSEAIMKLPKSSQAGIRSATQVYIGIGMKIQKEVLDVADGVNVYDGHRISLSKWERVAIALKEMYWKE